MSKLYSLIVAMVLSCVVYGIALGETTNAIPIVLNEEMSITIASEGESVLFSFIPERSG